VPATGRRLIISLPQARQRPRPAEARGGGMGAVLPDPGLDDVVRQWQRPASAAHKLFVVTRTCFVGLITDVPAVPGVNNTEALDWPAREGRLPWRKATGAATRP